MLPTTPQPQGTLGLVARRRHFGAFRHPLQHKALRSWQHYRPTTKNPVNPKNGWWVGNVADNAATSTGNRTCRSAPTFRRSSAILAAEGFTFVATLPTHHPNFPARFFGVLKKVGGGWQMGWAPFRPPRSRSKAV